LAITGPAAGWLLVRLETGRSFLVFFKKEPSKSLLFEKRSKNFCLLGVLGGAGTRRRCASVDADGYHASRHDHSLLFENRIVAAIANFVWPWHYKRRHPARPAFDRGFPALRTKGQACSEAASHQVNQQMERHQVQVAWRRLKPS
jgi:hypothetical protein